MISLISEYLITNLTVEAFETQEDAFELMGLFGVTDYDDKYVNVIMQADNSEPNDITAEVLGLTKLLTLDILKNHTVKLNDDATQETINIFLRAIYTLQDYSNGTELEDIVNMGYSDEETFCELVAITSIETVENLLMHVDSVSKSLITRIQEINTVSETFITKGPEHSLTVFKLRKFFKFVNADTFMWAQFNQGLLVGLPHGVYIDILGGAIINVLEDDALAIELVAAALASEEGRNRPETIALNDLSYFINDSARLTKLLLKVKDIIQKFELYISLKEDE